MNHPNSLSKEFPDETVLGPESELIGKGIGQRDSDCDSDWCIRTRTGAPRIRHHSAHQFLRALAARLGDEAALLSITHAVDEAGAW